MLKHVVIIVLKSWLLEHSDLNAGFLFKYKYVL